MTTQDTDPDLSPVQMAQLRAEFQRMGMTPVQAAEAAGLLAGMARRLPCMERAMNRLLADTVDMGATADRIATRVAAMAEGDRRPRRHAAPSGGLPGLRVRHAMPDAGLPLPALPGGAHRR